MAVNLAFINGHNNKMKKMNYFISVIN